MPTPKAVMKSMKESERRKARHVTVFLDVDGVLNSYPVTGKRFKSEGRKRVHAWQYELHFRPKIVKMLENFVRDRDADIVWLSTWSRLCRTEIEPKLGFTRSYPIIPMPDDTYNRFAGDPTRWWKAQAVEKWLTQNPGRRAVWVDDDLVFDATLTHFHNTYHDRLLMVAPKFESGLTEDNLQTIEDFSYPRPADSQPASADDDEHHGHPERIEFVPAGARPTDAEMRNPQAPAGPDVDRLGEAGPALEKEPQH